MGVAAYNRGSQVIARDLRAALPSTQDFLVQELNQLPKLPGAQTPFGDVRLIYSRGVWWVEDPQEGGWGFYYPRLRAAVRSWNIVVIRDGNSFIGIPKIG